jgi:hypothetical protein
VGLNKRIMKKKRRRLNSPIMMVVVTEVIMGIIGPIKRGLAN